MYGRTLQLFARASTHQRALQRERTIAMFGYQNLAGPDVTLNALSAGGNGHAVRWIHFDRGIARVIE